MKIREVRVRSRNLSHGIVDSFKKNYNRDFKKSIVYEIFYIIF